MWRSLGITLFIAAAAGGVALFCEQAGFFVPWTEQLELWLTRSGFAGADKLAPVPELQVAVAGLLAVFMAWAVADLVRVWHGLVVFLVAALLTATLAPTLALYGVLFSPFSGLVALAVAFVLGMIFAATRAGARRRRANRLLSHRVGGAAMADATRKGSPVVSPMRSEVSVVTVRLLNIGELTACLDADDVVSAARRFFSGCRGVLVDAGACLDESAPDCLRAVFGCFGGNGSEGAHAVAASGSVLALREAVKKLAAECEGAYGEEVRYGISVATGSTVVGVFNDGSDERFGVLGEAVDFGRRLCAANAVYGSRVLISARTRQLAEEAVEVRPMEMLFDPSANAMVEIYELIGAKGSLSPEEEERRDRFWEGVVHLRNREWHQAVDKFELAITDEVSDYPLEYFLAKARKEASGTSAGKRAGRLPRHARATDSI